MQPPESRDMGPQPLGQLMTAQSLKPGDLVNASPDQITHKLVSRAIKGRWLTPHSKRLVIRAWRAATGSDEGTEELFNY
ncbi:MAG: hypothetical protein RLZZ458_1532 [Planctomycetota bacterium]|jgi:hypothetical protein